jgi:hypothetical protein
MSGERKEFWKTKWSKWVTGSELVLEFGVAIYAILQYTKTTTTDPIGSMITAIVILAIDLACLFYVWLVASMSMGKSNNSNGIHFVFLFIDIHF